MYCTKQVDRAKLALIALHPSYAQASIWAARVSGPSASGPHSYSRDVTRSSSSKRSTLCSRNSKFKLCSSPLASRPVFPTKQGAYNLTSQCQFLLHYYCVCSLCPHDYLYAWRCLSLHPLNHEILVLCLNKRYSHTFLDPSCHIGVAINPFSSNDEKL